MDAGRRAHYADFYDGPAGDGPVAVVLGNCQAEALRVVLSTSAGRPLPLVRMPPVHELVAADMPALHRLLARADVLLTQPVRDDYRGLPVGTRQLAATVGSRTRLLRWPVIRYTGLHPYTAIVRHPSDMAAVPPVVPYHDLRTLAAAAGRPAPAAAPTAAALRAHAADSVRVLAARESAHTDVAVSDLLTGLGSAAMHTLNHPGNPVLVELARRVQRALGWPVDAHDPGRVLLGGVRAPLHAEVVDALGLPDPPTEHWSVGRTPVSRRDVDRAHRCWYADHPAWPAAGLDRHGERMALLGL